MCVCLCVCACVEDPHIVQRDVLPCQQYERAKEINGVCEWTQLLYSQRLKCHDFCQMTNFTSFPLRKKTNPALPGDVYRIVFIFFSYDIITPDL